MNGFKQASQTTITMREDQILVINVEAGDASEIGLHKFEVKLQKKDGSICGFMIAPNATAAMNSTSSGRIVARNYESNSGEWHFTGTYPGTGYEYNPEEEHSVEYSISMMEGKRELFCCSEQECFADTGEGKGKQVHCYADKEYIIFSDAFKEKIDHVLYRAKTRLY